MYRSRLRLVLVDLLQSLYKLSSKWTVLYKTKITTENTRCATLRTKWAFSSYYIICFVQTYNARPPVRRIVYSGAVLYRISNFPSRGAAAHQMYTRQP